MNLIKPTNNKGNFIAFIVNYLLDIMLFYTFCYLMSGKDAGKMAAFIYTLIVIVIQIIILVIVFYNKNKRQYLKYSILGIVGAFVSLAIIMHNVI